MQSKEQSYAIIPLTLYFNKLYHRKSGLWGICEQYRSRSARYCTKTTQVFFGHVFFSVTETDVTIKIYKEYSKMD